MIERYLLRYFLAVIDQGNFSRAAMACNVTQPTLSAGIARLEVSLGRPLFTRNSRRVELTAAGASLATHARQIEAQFVAAEREVRNASATVTRRLGILSSTPPRWTQRLLALLSDGNGAERVEIYEGRERELLERLQRGQLDLALTVVRAEQTRFAARVLLEEAYGAALPVTHPLAGRSEIAAEDLGHEPMIVRRNCEILSETSRYFTARGVRPFFPARTTHEAQALAYVKAGLGVTVMPQSFAGDGLVVRPLKDFAFHRSIGLLFAPHGTQDLQSSAITTALAQAVQTV